MRRPFHIFLRDVAYFYEESIDASQRTGDLDMSVHDEHSANAREIRHQDRNFEFEYVRDSTGAIADPTVKTEKVAKAILTIISQAPFSTFRYCDLNDGSASAVSSGRLAQVLVTERFQHLALRGPTWVPTHRGLSR